MGRKVLGRGWGAVRVLVVGGQCGRGCVDGDPCGLAALSGGSRVGEGTRLGCEGSGVPLAGLGTWGSELLEAIPQAECGCWASQHREAPGGGRVATEGAFQ